MTQQTFKVGDRVRIKTSTTLRIRGCGKTGVITIDYYEINWPYKVQFDDGTYDCFRAEHLEHQIKTLDNLIEGDVVVDKDDTEDTMTVAHVLKPGLYAMTGDDYEEPLLLYTATQLKNFNYVLQPDPEDDKTCLTVAEVAKQLGLNPDKLHIVADKKAA